MFHPDNYSAVTPPPTRYPARHSKDFPVSTGIPIADGDANSGFEYTYNGGSTPDYVKYWKVGLPTYSVKNFTQTAIVGGALTVQYVGKVESESGLFVGGHVYGVPLD